MLAKKMLQLDRQSDSLWHKIRSANLLTRRTSFRFLNIFMDEKMLLLSRKIGEEILVADGIRIVVSRIGNGRVTIGVDAPEDIQILRGELAETRSLGEGFIGNIEIESPVAVPR